MCGVGVSLHSLSGPAWGHIEKWLKWIFIGHTTALLQNSYQKSWTWSQWTCFCYYQVTLSKSPNSCGPHLQMRRVDQVIYRGSSSSKTVSVLSEWNCSLSDLLTGLQVSDPFHTLTKAILWNIAILLSFLKQSLQNHPWVAHLPTVRCLLPSEFIHLFIKETFVVCSPPCPHAHSIPST